MPVNIIMGEYLVEKYDWHWRMRTYYIFDAFTYPELEDKNKMKFSLWHFLEEYYFDGNFDYEMFIWQIDNHLKMSKANFPD